MAPPLKVTHLLALTLTDLAPSLRIVRLPVGPTFSFRIERYSVMKDVRKTSRSVLSQGLEYVTAPLVHYPLSLAKTSSDPSSSLFSHLFHHQGLIRRPTYLFS